MADQTERRLAWVAQDAQAELDEIASQLHSDPDLEPVLRAKQAAAARRRDTARGALRRYQDAKRRRR